MFRSLSNESSLEPYRSNWTGSTLVIPGYACLGPPVLFLTYARNNTSSKYTRWRLLAILYVLSLTMRARCAS